MRVCVGACNKCIWLAGDVVVPHRAKPVNIPRIVPIGKNFFFPPFFFSHVLSLLLRILSRSSACDIVLLWLATCVEATVNQMRYAGFS